jgi:helicase MOV-10
MNLIRNYRSHPKIISLLSELFYENKLLCCTSKEEYTSLERWNKRGTKQDFPFLFYALDNTKEDREEDSPSFFNIDEAITICSLVKNLLDQVRTISEEEVCVVTASHKQSVKIRQLMRKKDLRGVNVASTEEFQGREYKAIFVSTVRSSSTYLDHDRQYNIGFIEDEKRFNTALSRGMPAQKFLASKSNLIFSCCAGRHRWQQQDSCKIASVGQNDSLLQFQQFIHEFYARS